MDPSMLSQNPIDQKVVDSFGTAARAIRRVPSSRRKLRVNPILGVPAVVNKCQADTFKPFFNPVTSSMKDDWMPCSARAPAGDLLCPIHQKLLNSTTLGGGICTSKIRVRVPVDALYSPKTKYMPIILYGALNGKSRSAADAELKNLLGTETKFELHDAETIITAMGAKFGTNP